MRDETQKQLIRVVYPTDGGRIVLRTEENWNSNIEAHSVGQNGSLSEFWIRTERPYFYFKPVLVSDSNVQWSRGENFLAVATSGVPLEIYPYFREDARCSVCELMAPLPDLSGAQLDFVSSCRPVTTKTLLRDILSSTCTTGTTFSSRKKHLLETRGGRTRCLRCSIR